MKCKYENKMCRRVNMDRYIHSTITCRNLGVGNV